MGDDDPSCISTEDPYWMITKRGRRLQRYDLQLIMCGGMFKKILTINDLISFDSGPGNDEEKNYRKRRLAELRKEMEGVINASGQWKRNLKLYKNDGVRIRARCDGKVPVFTISQGIRPTGPNRGMEAGPSGSSGPTTKSKKRKNTGTNDDSCKNGFGWCMRTRSSSNLIVESSTTPKRRNRRRSKQRVEPFSLEETSVVTMADQRTMAELLQAPTEGYGDAIVIPAILAENFELKHGLLNLVTSKQFYGFEKEDPHAHIRWFNKITSTIKYKDVPNSSIKLMLFPFSIEGAARIWLKKEPPHSILTWEDLETFSEAWDRFKDLLHACPHHGFMELHQLDIFYNALTPTDQDSLNAAAGGNLLTKTPRDALTIIENKSKVRISRNKPVVSKVSANTSSSTTACPSEMAALTDVVNAMLRHVKTSPP
ncbi:hypothetical protein Tco_0390121 [Tanacetum coccineum]